MWEYGKGILRMISRNEALKPTNLQPGSEAKKLLMVARSFYGLPIFHPRDLKHEFHSCDNLGEKNTNAKMSIDIGEYTPLDDL
jgi:hypothetical protein